MTDENERIQQQFFYLKIIFEYIYCPKNNPIVYNHFNDKRPIILYHICFSAIFLQLSIDFHAKTCVDEITATGHRYSCYPLLSKSKISKLRMDYIYCRKSS